MSESHNLGKKGEGIAADYLRNKGYKIRHQNWKSGRRELDIVAENDDFIVFIEVKTRNEDFWMPPASAVTSEKQRLIIYTADSYLQKYDIAKESRFDVITIIYKGMSWEIDHIENAFYPTLR
jgi:putative endonuclease